MMKFSDWILTNGDNLQVSIFFALLVLLIVAERIFPKRQEPMDRPRRWTANLALTFLNFAALGVIPISLISAAQFAQTHGWGLLNVIHLPLFLLIPITLLLRGFISFATHWLFHMVPMFWRVHRVHHLDTEFDVTTTVRFHPLEFLIGLLPGVPLILIFGLTPWVLMLYELLDVAVTLWTHSNLKVPDVVDRYLRYFVVTPDLHRIHHSIHETETNSNYGAVFPIWDVIFGTFCGSPKDGQQRMKIGLAEVRGKAAHRPFWLLISIFEGQLSRTHVARQES